MRKTNDIASEMIPVRLIVSIVIMAAVTVMIAAGYNVLSITLAEHQVETEYRTLEPKLYTMIGSGVARDVDEINAGDGTKRTHTFDLPGSLLYLAFGVDPDPDNDGKLETGLTSNGSAVFYRVAGGNKHVIWLSEEFRFREGKFADDKWIIHENGQGFILNSGGSTTITFELVEKSREQYILIHGNDNIDL
jgi:hypothetical protein